MSNRKITPGDLDMTRPCPKNWNDMQGDDKKRFCEFCKKHVHDVTGMPEDEFRKLMKENDGRACVTITVPARSPRFSRFHRPFRQLVAAGFLLTGLSGCLLDRARLHTTGEVSVSPDKNCTQSTYRLTGDTVYMEPPAKPPVESRDQEKEDND